MKKTLMMVTALGMSMTQTNASVKLTNTSGVQGQFVNAAQGNVQSPDALASMIQDLQGQLQPEQSATQAVFQTASNSRPVLQNEDSIHNLISDLESQALQVSQQNDRLSTYEADLQARRLAEKKLEEERLAAKRASQAKAEKARKAAASRSARSASSKSSSRRSLSRSSAPAVAARRASRAAHSRSKGLCARYVRKALQAAGYKFTPNPSAYQYATRGTLKGAGFVKISNNSKPQVGDVVVVSRSKAHPHGHISIYDGKNWVSDFRQRKKSPYSRYYPYTTWRDARYLNNASSNGLYMANR